VGDELDGEGLGLGLLLLLLDGLGLGLVVWVGLGLVGLELLGVLELVGLEVVGLELGVLELELVGLEVVGLELGEFEVWLAEGRGVADELWLAVGVALADEDRLVAEVALGLVAGISAESTWIAAFGRLAHAPFTIGGPWARSGIVGAAKAAELEDTSTKPVHAPSVTDLARCVFTGTISPPWTSSTERSRLPSSSQYAYPD
jgi:hypothetical protein